MSIELVVLDGVTLDAKTGAPLVSAKQPFLDETEDFGDAPLMQCLGVSSAPYGVTDDGFCEGVIVTGAGARDAVCIGARDTRTAKVIGKLSPGDTVVHSTGPNQAAQLQLKEAKRQAALVSKTANGETLVVYLDGKNETLNALTPWGRIEISKQNGVVLSSSTGQARIQLTGDKVILTGTLMLGGAMHTGMLVAAAPGATLPAGIKGVPGCFVAMGV